MSKYKFTFADMIEMGIEYFSCDPVFVVDKDGNKRGGWRYLLDKNLTDEQKASLEEFENVRMGECQYRYAPEIIHDYVIILH